ncbi:MAG TPA: signal peptidase II [Jiangellaceae bacterium]|nr:signal peptidase II [Jiangellaceae bacterium]
MQATGGASLTGDAQQSTAEGRRRVGVLLAVAAVVLALDQLSKILAVARLTDGRVVEVLDGILQLRLVRNPGAAFSFATDMTVVLTVVAAAVVVVILRLSRRLTSVPWAVALGGLLGGALGNLTDRALREPAPLRGHVIDFLELPNFPVFNLADSAIVGSAILVAWLSLRGVTYDGSLPPGDRPDDGSVSGPERVDG